MSTVEPVWSIIPLIFFPAGPIRTAILSLGIVICCILGTLDFNSAGLEIVLFISSNISSLA